MFELEKQVKELQSQVPRQEYTTNDNKPKPSPSADNEQKETNSTKNHKDAEIGNVTVSNPDTQAGSGEERPDQVLHEEASTTWSQFVTPQTITTTLSPMVPPPYMSQVSQPLNQVSPHLPYKLLSDVPSPSLSHPQMPTPDWTWPNASCSISHNSVNLTLDESALTGVTERQGTRDNKRKSHEQEINPQMSDVDIEIALLSDGGSLDADTFDGASLNSEVTSTSISEMSFAQILKGCSSLERELRNRCLEEQFEFLQCLLSNLGFSNVDTVASQYYTAKFNPESAVSCDQRVSRQNQLPLLLAKLRTHNQVWSQWESYGYQYEIIKSAEGVVRTERRGAITTQENYISTISDIGELSTTNFQDSHGGCVSTKFRRLTRMYQANVRLSCCAHNPNEGLRPRKATSQKF